MKLEVTIEGLDELQREWKGTFLAKLRRGVRQAVQRTVDHGAKVAAAHVNRSDRTEGPHLKDVSYGRVTGAVAGGIPAIEGEIVAPKPYAVFLENGTAAHIIRPRTGMYSDPGPNKLVQRSKKVRLLVFKGKDGQWVSAKEVHHPGTAPHPFMGVAYFASEQRLQAEVEKAIEAAVESFNGGT